MTPNILPHNDAPLMSAWERYKAGQCDWSEVQAEQDALMPRCACDTPTGLTFSTIVNRKVMRIPVCAQCLEGAKTSRRMFIDSQRLIAGGIWIREEA